MLQDIRYALRALNRQRGFALTTILTIALGIALTTTIFSVGDNLMFRPLPYPRPTELYMLFGAARAEAQSRIPASIADHDAWRGTGALASIASYGRTTPVALTNGREVERVLSVDVDEAFLPTLGIQPALGRGFTAADARTGAAPVAIISAGLWRRDFGGDASVIGRLIDVGTTRVEIVGILPSEFLFPAAPVFEPDRRVEMLRPLVVAGEDRQNHNRRGVGAIGRLSPAISRAAAQAQLDAAQRAVAPRYKPSRVIPGVFDGVSMVPLQDTTSNANTRAAIVFLFIAALGVLLVGAVNVANMFLARGADRERELAVRAAIGASRGRLCRLLLTESVLLSLIGGLFGFLLAFMAFGAVVSRLPVRFVAFRPPPMDVRIALFAFTLCVTVGVVFGLLPSLKLSRANFATVVKQAGGTATGRAGWGRDALVFTELALAVMLIGAGLLVLRSFLNLMRVDTGVDPQHVLTLELTPPARVAPSATDERAAFYREALEAVRRVPGVEAAALTDHHLMAGGFRGSSLGFVGADFKRLYTRGNTVTTMHVTPEYFRVLGIPIVAGRGFADNADGHELVAIVSSRAGQFTGVDALGREVASVRPPDPGEPEPPRYTVIGVAADARDRRLEEDPMSTFYLPFRAEAAPVMVVRVGNPTASAPAVRAALHAFEPLSLIERVRPLEDLIAQSVAERRFNAFLYTAFSSAALLLTAIGVYGVISYTVSRRTREIGIRAALGATSGRLIGLVAGRMFVIVVTAMATGVGALTLLKNGLRSLVFNLQPNDPATLALAASVLLAVAAAAAYIPARRATRVNPVVALRAE